MFRGALANFGLDAAQIELCEKFYRLVVEQNNRAARIRNQTYNRFAKRMGRKNFTRRRNASRHRDGRRFSGNPAENFQTAIKTLSD